MYENLKYVMRIKKITSKELAELLSVSEKTICNKINGKTEWYYAEIVKLKKYVFPEYDTDWLFTFNTGVA